MEERKRVLLTPRQKAAMELRRRVVLQYETMRADQPENVSNNLIYQTIADGEGVSVQWVRSIVKEEGKEVQP